jgi:hypothetical protein
MRFKDYKNMNLSRKMILRKIMNDCESSEREYSRSVKSAYDEAGPITF